MNTGQRSVLIMAGGTGGHVFPALAVAKTMLAEGWRVEWMGTPQGIENEVVTAAGIPLNRVDIVGMRGKSLKIWFRLPGLLLRSIAQALRIIRQRKPDVVLGFGGFASGPGGVAARVLGKPLVIHEQNAVAGTANRWLAKIATRRLAAFPNSLRGAAVMGNPVRPEIAAIPDPEIRLLRKTRRSRLLVLGGSLGARKLNQIVPEVVARIGDELPLDVWHQCGRAHFEPTVGSYRQFNFNARVEAFLDDMGAAYYWADLVLCRAGALTVSEIMAAGVAAVLVPFPYAIDDHQTKNAARLVDNDAGVLLLEEELTATALAQLLRQLLANPQRLRTMAINARRLATPNAALAVAQVCGEVAYG